MTIRIYNAYKFDGTIEELLNNFKEYKKYWTDFCVKRIYDKLIQNLSDINNFEENFQMTKNIYNNIRECSIVRTHSYNDIFDIHLESVVYFYNNEIYFQLFPNYSYKIADKKIEDNKKCLDFHYQTETEPYFASYDIQNKLICEDDWKKRNDIWYNILDGSYTYHNTNCGFLYKFHNDYMDIDRKVTKMLRSNEIYLKAWERYNETKNTCKNC